MAKHGLEQVSLNTAPLDCELSARHAMISIANDSFYGTEKEFRNIARQFEMHVALKEEAPI